MDEPTVPVMFSVVELWVLSQAVPDTALLEVGGQSDGFHEGVADALLSCAKLALPEAAVHLTEGHCRLINTTVPIGVADMRGLAVGKFILLKTFEAWKMLRKQGPPYPAVEGPFAERDGGQYQIMQLFTVKVPGMEVEATMRDEEEQGPPVDVDHIDLWEHFLGGADASK